MIPPFSTSREELGRGCPRPTARIGCTATTVNGRLGVISDEMDGSAELMGTTARPDR
jgi:hypothetical protein